MVALGVAIAVGQRLLRGGGGGPLLGELGGDAVGVAKVQVGLLGSARDLQRDLDRIATRADTNSADGLHYVLEETVLALLRAPEYWVYGEIPPHRGRMRQSGLTHLPSGHAETNNERGPRNAEAKFNEYEMEARGKFQEETLVNFGGRTKRSGGGGPADAANEFIVVTVLVAVDGALKLPKVQGRAEVETCLKRLGAVATDRVQAVEVLWSPQEASDTLTQEEIISDYPDLVVL